MILLFKELVEAGCASDAYHLLHNSQSDILLQPIAVALQKYMGQEVYIAPEINEVANDVLKRFQGKNFNKD
jgi:hypothetical protein